jgi:hypothetical protein
MADSNAVKNLIAELLKNPEAVNQLRQALGCVPNRFWKDVGIQAACLIFGYVAGWITRGKYNDHNITTIVQ